MAKKKKRKKHHEVDMRKVEKLRTFGVVNFRDYILNAKPMIKRRKIFNKCLAQDALPTDFERLYNYGLTLGFHLKEINGAMQILTHTQKRQMKREQKVYIIRIEGSDILKIGISRNPAQRLADLQVANPFELYISATFEDNFFTASSLERRLHKKFKKRLLRGEWFRGITDAEVEEYMAEIDSLLSK